MPPEQRIELKILLHPHRSLATPQLQRPQIACLFEGLSPATSSHTKKRQPMPLRIRHKIAARMRHAIHFMERVREISNTRHAHGLRVQLAFDTSQRNRAVRVKLSSLSVQSAR